MGAAIALVFPGQGTQWVGMGEALCQAYPVARATFAEADDALGQPLTDLCLHGPQEELDSTVNAQPAILCYSISLWRALKERVAVAPVGAAGHSLGEYSALVAAEAIGFADAIRFVRTRGRLMQEAAGDDGRAGMLALIGADLEVAEAVASEAGRRAGESVAVANYNCPGQVVLGGHDAALQVAADVARELGVKRSQRLAISVASHTPFMAATAALLAQEAAGLPLHSPLFPVIGNASLAPLTHPDGIRREMAEHLVRLLNWPACVAGLVALGAETMYELGPKSVLAGLCKRIDRGASGTPRYHGR